MKKTNELFQQFEDIFGYPGEQIYVSPGRVNLIGEHTDYNGGKVFPCAITLGTYAVVALREEKQVNAYSENFADLGILSFSLDNIVYEKKSHWTNYVKGMVLYIQEIVGPLEHGFDLYINGTIPEGASLSSSASLEVLVGLLANDLYDLNLNRKEIAQLGMRVENEFLELHSGIMDQFVIAHAQQGHALLLDTNTLEYEQVLLDFPDHQLVIMDSLKRRELVESAYNERRMQCETALEMLGEVVSLSNLCELTESEFEQYKYAISDETIARRAKHVVYENQRTIQAAHALKEEQFELFGHLMNQSHLSLHENYEVTIHETDLLVRLAWEQTGVLGARMTGGGFGGCCIAIVEKESVDSFTENVSRAFHQEIGYRPGFYMVEAAEQARRLKETNENEE